MGCRPAAAGERQTSAARRRARLRATACRWSQLHACALRRLVQGAGESAARPAREVDEVVPVLGARAEGEHREDLRGRACAKEPRLGHRRSPRRGRGVRAAPQEAGCCGGGQAGAAPARVRRGGARAPGAAGDRCCRRPRAASAPPAPQQGLEAPPRERAWAAELRQGHRADLPRRGGSRVALRVPHGRAGGRVAAEEEREAAAGLPEQGASGGQCCPQLAAGRARRRAGGRRLGRALAAGPRTGCSPALRWGEGASVASQGEVAATGEQQAPAGQPVRGGGVRARCAAAGPCSRPEDVGDVPQAREEEPPARMLGAAAGLRRRRAVPRHAAAQVGLPAEGGAAVRGEAGDGMPQCGGEAREREAAGISSCRQGSEGTFRSAEESVPRVAVRAAEAPLGTPSELPWSASAYAGPHGVLRGAHCRRREAVAGAVELRCRGLHGRPWSAGSLRPSAAAHAPGRHRAVLRVPASQVRVLPAGGAAERHAAGDAVPQRGGGARPREAEAVFGGRQRADVTVQSEEGVVQRTAAGAGEARLRPPPVLPRRGSAGAALQGVECGAGHLRSEAAAEVAELPCRSRRGRPWSAGSARPSEAWPPWGGVRTWLGRRADSEDSADTGESASGADSEGLTRAQVCALERLQRRPDGAARLRLLELMTQADWFVALPEEQREIEFNAWLHRLAE
mmetsp:Transcript_7056/g.22632  ORF Transcript_7056/g.22632 Transcript_7056/m.22632 type:complete len:682 (+) Transcript_7056:103-2148(+)